MKVLVACEFSGTVRDAFIQAGHDAMSCDLLPTESPGPHFQGDIMQLLYGSLIPYAEQEIEWDLMIAHPECTYLTGAAEWAFADIPTIKGKPRNIKPGTLIGAERREARIEALDFVRKLMNAPIPRIAIENPVGKIGTEIRPADQWIHPFQFGHDASKNTGLWLKNLPELKQTNYVKPRMVCPECKGISDYDDAFSKKGCRHCGAEAGLLKPRWANQTDNGQNRLPPSEDRWKKRSETYSGIAEAMAEQWGNL